MKLCKTCDKSIQDDQYNVLISNIEGTWCHHQTSSEATFGYNSSFKFSKDSPEFIRGDS